MAYDAQKHAVFTQRCLNFAVAIQGLRDEAAALDQIYTNETLSGSDPAWVDTPYATAAEHVDMILLFRHLDAFFGNAAVTPTPRDQWITPFLANIGG